MLASPHRRVRPFACALAALALTGAALSGCSSESNTSADGSPDATATQTPSPDPTEDAESSTPSSSAKETTSAEGASDLDRVREVFSSVAPDSLLDQLDTCNPSGITDSFQCSGSEVGQFQFFKSSAKAASTTQLLTELRSSRVVEDTGSRVVGWSTLGTTAVITVVDNDKGLVMQQMVSSDQEEPETRIKELGLSEKAGQHSSESSEPSSTTTTSRKN